MHELFYIIPTILIVNTMEKLRINNWLRRLLALFLLTSLALITTSCGTPGTSVYAWGSDIHGQLGTGLEANSPKPVRVKGLDGVISVAAGHDHSLALKSDGTVWAWGSNEHGQLGNGTFTNSDIPVAVIGLNNVTSISASYQRSMALTSISNAPPPPYLPGYGYRPFRQKAQKHGNDETQHPEPEASFPED